ncbi:MAG: hypothetical protein GXO00_02130, partial [Candidatus Diapherotrites archaeon]|nr:hypothetical protein [Candidatus Diapherotrites archaeon]
VSTILMVAIAIAAAVVVYYITMDVVTQQGAAAEEAARELPSGAIHVLGVKMDVNGDADLNSAEGDVLEIYYEILGGEGSLEGSSPVVYIYRDGELICKVDKLLVGKDVLVLNGTVLCEENFQVGGVYYVQVTASDFGPSQKERVVN